MFLTNTYTNNNPKPDVTMENYENGLPPKNTSIADKFVSKVYINSEVTAEASDSTIQAVKIATDEKMAFKQQAIHSISFSTKQAGNNKVILYL